VSSRARLSRPALIWLSQPRRRWGPRCAGTLSQGGETGSGAGTGLVAVALSQFAEATSKSLSYVADQTGKSPQGAVNATKAYLHGDLDMAAEAQANAGKDASPPAYSLPRRGAK
jgi:hypothetical protein